MINVTDFFTKFGKFANAGNTTQTCAQTTIEDEVEDAVQALGGSDPIANEEIREGVRQSLRSLQGALSSAQIGTVRTPLQRLLIRTVTADNSEISPTLDACLAELIKQMQDNSKSLDASVPGCTPAYGGSNVGNGIAVVSTKRGDGLVNEHILAETITGTVTAVESNGQATIRLVGAPSTGLLQYDWPKGSGLSINVTSHTAASSDSLIINGGFETADANDSNIPDGWIANLATPGVTLKLTPIEVQTVEVSGSPTAGSYYLSWTNAAGQKQTTNPLPWNATQEQVSDELKAFVGLENISVVTTGTSPNYTHTITFTGVPNPDQLTSQNLLTGGTPVVSHATTTAGSANVVRGARSLEFDADGAQLTDIHYLLAVESKTQYCFNMMMMADVVPAAGVITVELVDGIAGTVIADDQAANNAFTIDCTALTTSFAARNGVFRTPTVLPPLTYLRIRISTAISSGTSIFMDEAVFLPMTKLYNGGLFTSVFTGSTEWELDDTLTLPVTNDRGGALHEWGNRVYDLRTKELLIPSDSAGGETESDSLIS